MSRPHAALDTKPHSKPLPKWASLPDETMRDTEADIAVYVKDAMRIVLARRPEKPLQLICEYFTSVFEYNNVAGREWAYVSATRHNVLGFIFAMEDAFGGGAHLQQQPAFAAKDFGQLAQTLSPDFPSNVSEHILTKLEQGGVDVKELSYASFSRAMFVFLYFQDFFGDVKEVLEKAPPARRKPSGDKLLVSLTALASDPGKASRCIPMRFLEPVLVGLESVTFAKFCAGLLLCEELSASVLVRPPPHDEGLCRSEVLSWKGLVEEQGSSKYQHQQHESKKKRDKKSRAPTFQ